MTNTRDLLAIAKKAHQAKDPLEQLVALRELEDAVTPARREVLLTTLKVRSRSEVAKALGISPQAVSYQTQLARRGSEV